MCVQLWIDLENSGSAACAKTRTSSSWRLAFAKANKTSKYVENRLFRWETSEDKAEMLGTHSFSGTSANSRSMPVWILGLVFGRVQPAPTWKAKMHKKLNLKKMFNFYSTQNYFIRSQTHFTQVHLTSHSIFTTLRSNLVLMAEPQTINLASWIKSNLTPHSIFTTLRSNLVLMAETKLSI
jgi:hypothetical protein